MRFTRWRRLAALNSCSVRDAVEGLLTGLTGELPSGEHRQALLTAFGAQRFPPTANDPVSRLKERLSARCEWSHWIAEIARELQWIASHVPAQVWTMQSPDTVRIVMECEEPDIAEACLTAAVALAEVVIETGELELSTVLQQLLELDDELALGLNTGPSARAARKRGIPIYRLDRYSLVQLGEGVHQQRIRAAATTHTGLVAERVATNKHLAKCLWSQLGIPVPQGRLVVDVDDALATAADLGWPVVVKPCDADWSDGVTTGICSADGVVSAYQTARAHSSRVLVERHLPGLLHRLLVVNDELYSAVRLVPPQVTGDGRATLRELVEAANRDARRGPDLRWPWRLLELNEDVCQGDLRPDSVIDAGQVVRLACKPADWTRGTVEEVLEDVHPSTREFALDATRMIGVDVAGIDVIATDIRQPLSLQDGGFLEINAEPAICLHTAPRCDRPRPVGEAIVDMLFPSGKTGRVPLVLIIGEDLANLVGRQLAECARSLGTVGFSTPVETQIHGRTVAPQSQSPPDRLAALLTHPRTEFAILCVPLAHLLATGLGTDRITVTVVAESTMGRLMDQSEPLARALLQRLAEVSSANISNSACPPFTEETAYWLAKTAVLMLSKIDSNGRPHRETGVMDVADAVA